MATPTLTNILGRITGLDERIKQVKKAYEEFQNLPPEQRDLRIKAATGQIKVDTSQVPKFPDTQLQRSRPTLGRLIEPKEPPRFVKQLREFAGVKEKPELELTSEGRKKGRELSLQKGLLGKTLSPTEELFAARVEEEDIENLLATVTGPAKGGAKALRLIQKMKAKGIATEAMPKLLKIFEKGEKVAAKAAPTALQKILQTKVAPKPTEIAKPVSPELQKKAKEIAARGGTAEEFVASYKGSGTQYGEYNPSLRAGGTPGSKRLTELRIDPNKEITIYRGIDDTTGNLPRKIQDGDFVTTDFDSARAYTGSEKDVVSMRVKAKDLFADDPDAFLSEPFYKGSEYIYSTKQAKTPDLTKSQLTDIYNQAAKGVKPAITAVPKEFQLLAQKANKYKSMEEFVEGIKSYAKNNKLFDKSGNPSEVLAVNKIMKRKPSEWNKTLVDFMDNYSSLKDFFTKNKIIFPEAVKIGKLEYEMTPANVKRELNSLWEIPMSKRTPEVKQRISQLTDFYNQVTKTTKISPQPILPTLPTKLPEVPQNTIQKLINAVDEAIPLRAEQKKLYSEELAKRTARVAAVGAKIGGEKGFFAQLGQLKGELPKKQFEAIRNKFNQEEIDSLFNTIEQTKTLLPLEKIGTKGGLQKLFEGTIPTPSEIEKLKEVFPKELIDAVLARRPFLEKLKDIGGELWNFNRTMMATLDLSAPFRQGVFMIGRPVRFAGALKDMFKFAVSEKAYQGLIESIQARPTYLKMKQGRLALTEIGGALSQREEAFMSNLPEKIPLYGALVKGSNRAYTGFLNKLRADIFDDILKKAEVIGRKVDSPLLESIADFVNAGTGRGKFGLAETGIIPKSMEKAAVILNSVFFSPRLMASRLNLLNPYFYVQLDPLVRKEAMKTLFATSGILGSVYGLWKLNGGDVGMNPKSADFGKIKIGNTRYDLLGGFQQYIKLATQLITGEIVSSTTGRTITLGEGFKPLTRKEIILRFFENKTSPIASFLIGLLTGQTATGEDIDVPTEVINRFIPMVVQDLYDISQEKGAEGILYGLPAIFGVGVQTYGKQELKFGESRIGEPTAQIRPVPELAAKIRELIIGRLPIGASKGFNVETYYDQLSNLPREEAAGIFDKIAKVNPELAKKLSGVVEERELGITIKDKDLKAKGVASGDRALAVKRELDKLKTKEEKAILWDDYVKKGIITIDVSKQLLKLLNPKPKSQ